VFRLIKHNKIQGPGLEMLVKTIDDLESQIQIKEERLREIIMRSDMQKQIPEKFEPFKVEEKAQLVEVPPAQAAAQEAKAVELAPESKGKADMEIREAAPEVSAAQDVLDVDSESEPVISEDTKPVEGVKSGKPKSKEKKKHPLKELHDLEN
jgi:hypothetical protein